jgi:hypothetical protein
MSMQAQAERERHPRLLEPMIRNLLSNSRDFALFGRRLQERVDSVGIPASKNLHKRRHALRTETEAAARYF